MIEMKNKPTIFVGSAKESLPIAYAIQQNLEYKTDVTVWNQGIFKLSKSALNNLISALSDFDFGIFVLSPDDISIVRGEKKASVRQNVLFELGLFMGRLGPERTFFIVPRTDVEFHLPSDLFGITPATYNPERINENLQAMLGTACTDILNAINSISVIEKTIYESDLSNKIEITRSREEHYELTTELIKNASKRVYIIERTPVLLFGPRDFWYEKSFFEALKHFSESTSIYKTRRCQCMMILDESVFEFKSLLDKKTFYENLKDCIEIEKSIELRFCIKALPTYYGSFLVADNNCSLWFKGQAHSIGLYLNDSKVLCETLIDIFHRLVGTSPETLSTFKNNFKD